MAYYFRVFCASESVPKLSEVLNWVKERGVTLRTDPADLPHGTETTDWGEPAVRVWYQEGREPLLAEINHNTGEQSLAGQEIGEFIEVLSEQKKSKKRDRVIDHLKKTRYVLACQIPVENFTDAGFHALDVFLAYFLVHSDGMVQADGQGFYEMGKLIVDMAA